jgi:hypothetical protein
LFTFRLAFVVFVRPSSDIAPILYSVHTPSNDMHLYEYMPPHTCMITHIYTRIYAHDKLLNNVKQAYMNRYDNIPSNPYE